MEDDMLVCPYDPSHFIHALRMPRHLLKCRKNHPSVELSVCPFNGFHEVPAPELRYHMEHCPDKALLDRDKHFLNDQPRVKGYTELPKCRDHELCDDDDELWDSEQLQDRSNLLRSRLRTRMRREEDTRLRLPNRKGIAARLTTSLLALEKSGTKSQIDGVDSDHTQPNGQQPRPELSGVQSQDYRNCGPDVSCDCGDWEDLETSSSVQFNDGSHGISLREDPQCVSRSNTNIVNKTLPESDHNMSLLPTNIISSQGLKSTPCSSAQGHELLTSNHQITQREPQRTLQELNYHAFMIGRGRANPSFSSKSNLDQRIVGRGGAFAAQSKKLTQLAYSLGRGRGLNKMLNPTQSER